MAPDPNRLQRLGAEEAQKPFPVARAMDPSVEPGAVALHGPTLLVESVIEVVMTAVAALHGRGEGAVRLVDHRHYLELGREDQARITQDAFARPDLLGDDD